MAFSALVVTAAPATALDGDCFDSNFARYWEGAGANRTYDVLARHASVIRQDAPVYATAIAGNVTGRLDFQRRVKILDPGEMTSRIKIGDITTLAEIGWVEREDLLCRVGPVLSEKNLWQRIYVRTATSLAGEVERKKLFESPEGTCKGGLDQCREVSTFSWFFVYGEEAGRMLVSNYANLSSPDATVLGWLDAGDGIKWNTASALRPKEELATRPGPYNPAEEAEDYVCAYATEAEMDGRGDPANQYDDGKPHRCREIFGGDRWFASRLRLPIIDETAEAFKVAFTGSGATGDQKRTLEILLDRAGADAQALNELDVFFVIDGTESMASVIDAIRGSRGGAGLVGQLRDRLRGKLSRGAKYRVGFRIYRDSMPGGGDDGVASAEHFSLRNEPCDTDASGFEARFADVRAKEPDFPPGHVDDFEENMFAGLAEALSDVRGCDNQKLFIVIGDHGYSIEAQKARGQIGIEIDELARAFRESFDIRPLLLFVQMPPLPEAERRALKNPEAYDAAYAAFRAQSKVLIEKIYADLPEAERNKLFVQLSRTQISGQSGAAVNDLVAGIDGFINPDAVLGVIERIELGQSVVDAIDAVSRRNEGIPGVFWGILAEELCRQVGEEQCNNSILQEVGYLYIPKDQEEKLEREVLLTSGQLADWDATLRQLESETGIGARREIVDTMVRNLSSNLNLNFEQVASPRDETRMISIGEILQTSRSLPYGFESPLLAYSLDELRDPSRVPDCEFQFIFQTAIRKKQVLEYAAAGTQLPVFEPARPSDACRALMTPKGKRIAGVKLPIDTRQLNSGSGIEEKSIRFPLANEQFYWLPVRYMP